MAGLFYETSVTRVAGEVCQPTENPAREVVVTTEEQAHALGVNVEMDVNWVRPEGKRLTDRELLALQRYGANPVIYRTGGVSRLYLYWYDDKPEKVICSTAAELWNVPVPLGLGSLPVVVEPEHCPSDQTARGLSHEVLP